MHPPAGCHLPLALPLSSSAGEGTDGDVQSMTVASLPLCFFPKLRNLLNPLTVVSLGDRAVPENLLPALPGGVLGAGAALFSARSSRFFRTRTASASSNLSMDWSRELHDGRALGPDDLTDRVDSSELSLAGASSAFVVAISAAAAVASAGAGAAGVCSLAFTSESRAASELASFEGSGSAAMACSSAASLLM